MNNIFILIFILIFGILFIIFYKRNKDNYIRFLPFKMTTNNFFYRVDIIFTI